LELLKASLYLDTIQNGSTIDGHCLKAEPCILYLYGTKINLTFATAWTEYSTDLCIIMVSTTWNTKAKKNFFF